MEETGHMDTLERTRTDLTPYRFTLDSAVKEWLAEKEKRTGSPKTKKAYEDTMQSFCATLSQANLNLLSNPIDISRLAALWASWRVSGEQQQPVAASTYDQRLAIISSWYSFAQETYKLALENPIKSVKKRPVQAYAGALPIEQDVVTGGLDAINRERAEGLRDYALLSVALATGRRAAELARVCWRDVLLRGQPGAASCRVQLTFLCKGGKVKRDTLDADTSAVLLDYLFTVFGNDLSLLAPDTRLWLSFARNTSRGQPIGPRALSDIVKKHLGTSKVHALRHTFSVGMMRSGASITDLQQRLGHESVRTTQIYAAELESDINPHAEKLTARFGIKQRRKKD